jgi:hypothetical protein
MTINTCFRQRSFVYVVPVLLMLIFGCTKPQITFQSVYNGDNATNIIAVDTFAVKLSTVFLDSFTTSGSKVQLLGRYIDPYFGTITSQSYTDIATPFPFPTLSTSSIYDSIVLILRLNKTFYGDTTKQQRFLVSQLTQVMNYPGIQTAFYSNQSIPYSPTILGSTDITINPTAGLTSQRIGDTMKIAMPDAMGRQLFDLLYRQPDTITNPAIFRGFFNGLAVYPDTTLPGAIYGFMDTMKLRIFYHEPGPITVEKTIDFVSTNLNTQFNRITADRSATQLASLSHLTPELQSTATGNKAFLQPITSLYTKIIFPSLSNLPLFPDYVALMKAELVVKPAQGTYSPILNLPPSVGLAMTNYANTIGTSIPAGTGNLLVDYLYGTNTSYSYDITSYVQSAMLQGAPYNAINGLIMSTPATAFNTTFNRAVFGDQFNQPTSNQVSLNLYYASYY